MAKEEESEINGGLALMDSTETCWVFQDKDDFEIKDDYGEDDDTSQRTVNTATALDLEDKEYFGLIFFSFFFFFLKLKFMGLNEDFYSFFLVFRYILYLFIYLFILWIREQYKRTQEIENVNQREGGERELKIIKSK